MSRSSLVCGVVVAGIVAGGATDQAAAAIVPVSSATIAGSNYDLLSGAFDAQPATDPVAGSISTQIGNSFGGFYGSDPSIGFDFGADFATKTFTDIFILQGSYGGANMTLEYYWSDDTTYDAGIDAAAPNFNLFNYSAYGNTAEGRWELQYHNPAGVTPEARYLIGRPISGSQGNFLFEIAFVNTLPEPASAAMLAGAGLALLKRKRAR